jgi:hypothetical protein
MRYLFFVLAFALLSCSKSSTSENTSDTTQIALSAIDETKINSPAVYVGFAGYLEETKEFYVSLYFKDINDKVTPGDFGDSTIYHDGDGYFRKWIPLDKAREHFVLDGLEKLRLYNADHQFIGTASLLRVEYVEDMITSEYVAIYKFAHVHSDRYAPYYAVSDHADDAFQKDFSSQEINDPALNALIIENLKLDTASLWVMSHQRTKPSGRIYSTVNFDMQALIVETHNDQSTIMETVTDGYHFGIARPIPIMIKGKPILLVTYYFPYSEDSGDYLMTFDGSKFESVKYSRVELEK